MKGILKSLGLFALCITSGLICVGAIIGIAFSTSKVNQSKQEKANLLNDYSASEEYNSRIQTKEDLYKEGLEKGIFTQEEYNEKMQELASEEYLERSLAESDDLSYVDKYQKINKKIDKQQNDVYAGLIPIMAGSGGLIIGIEAIKKKSKKEKTVENEEICMQ